MRTFEFGGGDVSESLSATFEQEIVEGFRLVEAQAAELSRDGEGNHKVRGV